MKRYNTLNEIIMKITGVFIRCSVVLTKILINLYTQWILEIYGNVRTGE